MSAPYMPLFVADYLADTAHLSAAEHGAYLLLIMNYWQREKPLPAEDRKLARIARMSDSEWTDARPALAEFFQEQDGEWRHARIEAEMSVAQQKSAKAKASARASVASRQASAQRTLNDRSTDAELLGEDREGKERKEDTANAASSASAPVFDWIDIERQCCEAVASDKLGSFAPVRELIERGAEVETLVLPLLRSRKAPDHDIGSWRYFVPAIAAAMLKAAPASKSHGPPQVFVCRDSPAWADLCRATRHKPTLFKQERGSNREGWYFPASELDAWSSQNKGEAA